MEVGPDSRGSRCPPRTTRPPRQEDVSAAAPGAAVTPPQFGATAGSVRIRIRGAGNSGPGTRPGGRAGFPRITPPAADDTTSAAGGCVRGSNRRRRSSSRGHRTATPDCPPWATQPPLPQRFPRYGSTNATAIAVALADLGRGKRLHRSDLQTSRPPVTHRPCRPRPASRTTVPSGPRIRAARRRAPASPPLPSPSPGALPGARLHALPAPT